MRGGEVLVAAPAKVNLGLQVLRRRPDGYHEIRTLFQSVSLADRLRLRPLRRGVRLHCPGVDCAEKDNLAWRAADLFLDRTGSRAGLEVFVEKAIPAGGGLGGGSSDAAAVLLGACRLFGLRPPLEELAEWAAGLGSDVPFFLSGGAALGKGRGEIIEPLAGPPPRGAVLLYSPGFPSSTAEVYGEWRPPLTRAGRELTILVERWRDGGGQAMGRAIFNDLEGPVLRLHPALGSARDLILGAGAAGAQVTGSGSCLFGVFRDRAEAARAARRLRALLPGRLTTAAFLPPRLRWGVVKR